MKTKINIAEIIKDKPKGTKLDSPIFGNLRYEDLVPDLGEFTVVTSDNTSAKHSFWSDGRYNRHGEPLMLLPSKEMPDWSKFAWKKGDVLVHKDGDVHIIFEGFSDDTYCSFVGKYYLWKENNNTEQFCENERLLTSDFQKAGKDAAQTYINTIEKRLGGKLNRESLEIEKAQPEFKDGDIVTLIDSYEQICILIFQNIIRDSLNRYCILTKRGLFTEGYSLIDKGDSLRLATAEEKQQLFDALAKKGKAWDAEKKQIVELKSKVKLKPFDKVLVRDCYTQRWRVNFFSSITKEGCYICASGSWNECIPYNEETAKLIGTTDNWEG